MSDALATPTRRARREQISTDHPINQQPDIVLPATGDVSRTPDIIQAEGNLDDDYQALLAMNEEPVTIMIYPSSEPNAPIVKDCWVNGKGAEVLIKGQWVSFGCLPIGTQVTTKRKYVEVLLRSKVDTINTQVDEKVNENPVNRITRNTTAQAVVSILSDANPNGREWLRRMMAN